MKIICPHCQLKNDIEYAEHIKCKRCEKSFKHYSYRVKTITKPIVVGASAALLTGGIIGYTVENTLDQVRYPIELEYSIITQCANPSTSYKKEYELQKNIKTCICTLKKTIQDVGENYADDEFIKSFNHNLRQCK